MRGLLKARFERKKLVFDDLADPLLSSRLAGNCGLIAIEEDGDLHDLAAINLAYSCGLDVALLPPTDRKVLFSLPRDLNEWSRDRSHYAYQSWNRWTRAALRDIDFAAYCFATFFTTGLPYGLFLANSIPCSHVIVSRCGCPNSERHRAGARAPFVWECAFVFSSVVRFRGDERHSYLLPNRGTTGQGTAGGRGDGRKPVEFRRALSVRCSSYLLARRRDGWLLLATDVSRQAGRRAPRGILRGRRIRL